MAHLLLGEGDPEFRHASIPALDVLRPGTARGVGGGTGSRSASG